MTVEQVLLLLCLLQIKHLLIDWCWQPEYEWKNKGTYGHFGGVSHALKNAIGTAACFVPFSSMAIVIAVLVADFMAHYHIDFFKMNINRIKSWGPLTHNEFWMLTGLDQFCHQLTYLILVLLAIS